VSHVQVDPRNATGATHVSLAADGTARYRIIENVAWDLLEWTPELRRLAQDADAVCFGTLVQRSATSRDTVRRFLEHTRADCLKVFDVNLRQPFFSGHTILQSLKHTDVLKLNHEELPEVLRLCSLPSAGDSEGARLLQQKFGLKAVCITRGSDGSIIVAENDTEIHSGIAVDVADTIGAGDAFTAALTVKLLLSAPLRDVSDAANGMGAWVASQRGAMPIPDSDEASRLRQQYGISHKKAGVEKRS
jgi:fructokinase